MTTQNNSGEMDTLLAALQTDRLIEVYIATSNTPIYIQAAVLTGISEYFVRALKNENLFGGGEKGVLRFPEDNEVAWKTLVCWKFKGKVEKIEGPKMEVMKQLVYCWSLGDKYDVKDFQDLVMLELLAERRNHACPLDVIRLAFENTPQNSALRKLMAREALYNMHNDGDEARYLEMFDGMAGAISDLVYAYNLKDARGGAVDMVTDIDEDDREELMVGTAQARHSIFDQ